MLKKTQVYDEHKKFTEGRERFENEPHCRRLRTSYTYEHIYAARRIIKSDRRLTVSEIESETRTNYGSAQTIISDGLKIRSDQLADCLVFSLICRNNVVLRF